MLEKRNCRRLLEVQWAKQKFICVGLDTDPKRIPEEAYSGHIKGRAPVSTATKMVAFNRMVVRATAAYAAAYKPNFAFYLAKGIEGIEALQETVRFIRIHSPDTPIILDAKWADIDNTNEGYVEYAFRILDVDGVTLNPYLGLKPLEPFFAEQDRMFFILCKTSNKGSDQFQNRKLSDKQRLYENVAEEVAKSPYARHGNLSLVVGATYPKQLQEVRSMVGTMPILIPGIGAQGGDLETAVTNGANHRGNGFLINSSRGIIYARREGVMLEKSISHAALDLHMAIRKIRNPDGLPKEALPHEIGVIPDR